VRKFKIDRLEERIAPGRVICGGGTGSKGGSKGHSSKGGSKGHSGKGHSGGDKCGHGNNGYGNGGHDGSPNGKQDCTR